MDSTVGGLAGTLYLHNTQTLGFSSKNRNRILPIHKTTEVQYPFHTASLKSKCV